MLVAAVEMRLHPCTITVVTLHPSTGAVLSSKAHSSSAIAYCIDESNKKCIKVGVDDKYSREYSVQGGVKLHARFVDQGKATLTLVKRNINLMISQADPAALKEWMHSLATGRPPPPPPPPPPASAASSSSSPRPASAPPKRHLAPSTPSGANAASASPRDSRSKGKMGRAPAWASPPDQADAAGRRLSPSATATLTSEQQEVMREVVLGGKSVFFTGGAGVGKSHLLRQLVLTR